MSAELQTFDYGTLPMATRADVQRWHEELSRISGNLVEALRAIAARLGVSYSTAKTKYYAWKAAGRQPSALVDGRACPEVREALHPDFIEWWRTLVEGNQRKCRPAYRLFAKKFFSGEPIPGLPLSPRTHLPKGCSYKNLMRYKPTKLELAVMRVGRARGAEHAPQVFTTRAGLWCGSHYMFDDLWHDNFVVYKSRPVRVLEFDALDVFSGCKIGWGCKPRIQNADGTMEGLKEKWMRMLLAQVLFQHGYSPRGTVLMAEHGTAAIRDDLAAIMERASGGKITVQRSGITGEQQAVAGMFKGRGLGNFRFKSPLESLRNLIHNELGFLPGQTGKDVDHRPEELHGRLNYVDKLGQAMMRLAPERAALLRLPLVEYHSQFIPLLEHTYDFINRRGEWDWFSHDLEGWEACGHIALEYCLNLEAPEWMGPTQLAKLPSASMQVLADLATADARHVRQRKLSPREVWEGKAELVRVPAYVVAEILGPEFAREEKIKSSYFEFQDAELCPEPMRFESRITTPEGATQELDPDKYLVFLNPFHAAQLFVHDAKGRYLGLALRDQRISRVDHEAVMRRAGHVAAREADLLKPVRARHTASAAAAVELREHNARVLEGAPITPQEKERARSLKRFEGGMDDLADPTTPNTSAASEPTELGDVSELL